MIPLGVLASAARRGGGGGDPHWANVVSLLHFDTSFEDSKGRTWVPEGGASVGLPAKFGPGAYSASGSGGMIRAVGSTDFDIGISESFTLEAWIYLVVNNVQQSIFSRWFANGSGSHSGGIEFDVTASGKIRLVRAGVAYVLTGNTTIPAGTWTHVAAVRNVNACALYVNGALDAAANNSEAFTPTTTSTAAGVGASPNTGYGYIRPLLGGIDEFRFTKGVARYTAAFTPPDAPFPSP